MDGLPRFSLRHAAALAALALGAAPPARASAHVEQGAVVEDARLEALAGPPQALFGAARVHVLVFLRPGQDRSVEALRGIAACERSLTDRGVRVVGLVSSSVPRAEAQAFVQGAGLSAPVLVDAGDALYGKLEVRQHPIAIVVGQGRRVTAAQPYLSLNWCDALLAHVRFELGELDAAARDAILHPDGAARPSDAPSALAMRHVRLAERTLAGGNCALAAKQLDEALALDPANAKAAELRKRCPAAPATP